MRLTYAAHRRLLPRQPLELFQLRLLDFDNAYNLGRRGKKECVVGAYLFIAGNNPQGITEKNDALPGIEGNPAKTGEIFTDNARYIRTCSNTKKRKIEDWAGDKLLRKSTKISLKAHQSRTVTIDKMGESIDVVFDSKTTTHLSNDVAMSSQFLWNEVMDRMPQILSKSKLVAHELNTKLDKKPWAVEYFYYEYKTQNYTFYLSVEYNNIIDENRQFYRLYSITSKLRKSAIKY